MKRFLLILLLASPAFSQTIDTVEPSSGPTSGGIFVHFEGDDLFGFALGCPSIECSTYVKFGDAMADIAINTRQEIVALAPAHASGTVDVTVNIAGKKKIVLPNAFTYREDQSIIYENVLLPILVTNVPGAFGSSWETITSFYNSSTAPLEVRYGDCNGDPLPSTCKSFPVPPKQTTLFTPMSQPNGLTLQVRRDRMTDLDIALRVHDLSKQNQNYGTAVPVVRGESYRLVVRLQNVTTDSHFRSTLRAYPYFGDTQPIKMLIFDEFDNSLVVADTLSAPFQVTSLTDTYPQLHGHGSVRIELTSSITPAHPIWAFVSVTNNDTQLVTLIAPSP